MKKFLAVLLVVAMMFSCLSFAAAETTDQNPTSNVEPTDTEVPTEEKSEDPTEEKSEDPTEEPTEDPTEEPTEEASEEPTEEASEEPTEEATEESTEESTEEATEESTEEATEEQTEGHSWPRDDMIDQWEKIENADHEYVVSKKDPLGEGNEDGHVSVIYYPNPDKGTVGVLRVHCELHPNDPNDVKEFAIRPTDHDYTSFEWIVEPNCITKKDGKKRYNCDTTLLTWVEDEERKVSVTWDYDENSDSYGYFIGHDPNCGDNNEEIVPWGHQWSDDPTKKVEQPYHDVHGKHPDCYNGGELVAYCLICGVDRTKEDGTLDSFTVEPLHHRSLYDKDGDGYGDIDHLVVRLTQVPTCTKQGKAEIYCPLCGNYLTATECDYFWEELGGEEDNRPTVEIYQKYNEETKKWVALTEDEKAAYELPAEIDEYPFTMDKDPENHTLSDWVLDVVVKEPTCTEEGEGIYHRMCVECRTVFGAEHIAIPMIPHSWEITKAPTCTEEGTHKCKVCGLEESMKINPYAHPADKLKLIDHTPVTCEQDGENVYQCQDCMMLVSEVLPMYNHPEEVRSATVEIEGWCGNPDDHHRKVQFCLQILEEQVYDENGNPMFPEIYNNNWYGIDLSTIGVKIEDGTIICAHEFLIEDLGPVAHKYNKWVKRNDFVPADKTDNGVVVPEYWTRYCTVCGHQDYRLYDEAHEEGWDPSQEVVVEEPTEEKTEETTKTEEKTEETVKTEEKTEETTKTEEKTEEPAKTEEKTEEPAKTEEKTEEPKKNGIVKDNDGKYRAYKDGEVDTTVSGIVDYDGGKFIFANGVLQDVDGLWQDPATKEWGFYADGQFQDKTGFAEYDGYWFMLKDGKLDTTANGIYDYDGGKFVFAAGQLQKNLNGLWLDPATNEWVFVAGGQVQTQYSGVAEYNGEFFVLKDGKLDKKDGTVTYDGVEFLVSNGQLYPLPTEETAA